uniref:Ras association (RalGDS/AF-6) and pleckstrin homology domains 1a n=1 Tax=Callorhinchus milii TaxID=7868 RepID=A0A4W3H269_CALMI
MDQISDEDVDHAVEEDSDQEDQDLDKMFGAWLGELDKLTQSLDTGKPEELKKSPLRQETNLANFSYRFSMYNLNEALSQGDGVDLDALMADLCSMEQELSNISKEPSRQDSVVEKTYKEEVPGKMPSKETKPTPKQSAVRTASKHGSLKGSPLSSRSPKALHTNFSLDDIAAQLEQATLSMDEAGRQASTVSFDVKPNQHKRTGSSGTVSDADIRSTSTSSRSSLTSATSSQDSLDIDKVTRPQELDLTQQGQPTTEHSYLDRETSIILRNIAGKPSHLLTKEEQAARQKAEKIRVALEKIKEAQIKKLVIRVHMSDDSSKTMMVDERQTVRQVLGNLMDKSHCGFSSDWSLVETIPELQMERIFEDHENLVENLLNWTRDSQNKLMFTERIEKYALFKNPQNYLLGKRETSEMGDRNKEALLEEFFCGGSVTVPEIEGLLWLKEDGKKSWKKRYFLLRASGIYYVPKGKTKTSRDLACFIQLDHVNVYYGQDYRSKYKAPTDYCCALKHPQIQKKSQYIKYLCCDDVRTLHQWVNGIRIAKYGRQLYDNYQEAVKRAETAYEWSSLSSASMKSGSSSSSLPESHSNHSSQSDSGVSDIQSTGHVRSQSIVSSIFSEAWKRGTQLEEQQHTKVRCPTPSLVKLKHSPSTSTPPPAPALPPMMKITQMPPPPPPHPTLKQASVSVNQSPILPSPTISIVKQSINQFQPLPCAPKVSPPPPIQPPTSPPAVKAKPKWQPTSQLPSPEFPPPPPESSLPQPPPPPPGPTAPPTPVKSASIKKSPKSSSPVGKKPPPTPQRHSSMKGPNLTDSREPRKSVDAHSNVFELPLVSPGPPPPESVGPPPAPPKPGKLNLAAVNLMFPPEPVSEFPSPPSDSDFPPPPPDLDLLPPPPLEMATSGFAGTVPPKVAVVNPQPQTWSKASIKKAPPPVLPKRSDSTRLTQGESVENQIPPSSPVPVSPKPALSVQPHFLADLNRTLQRKSFTRHGSLPSGRLSKAEPITTMDDMALPPPPPELLLDQDSSRLYTSGNISGYATLRRGPPPAPPKRGDNTKLSRD